MRCCIDFALEITHSPEFIFSVQTKRLSNISSVSSTSVNGHSRACNVVRFESHRRYLNQSLLCQVQNEHYVLNASTVLLVHCKYLSSIQQHLKIIYRNCTTILLSRYTCTVDSYFSLFLYSSTEFELFFFFKLVINF